MSPRIGNRQSVDIALATAATVIFIFLCSTQSAHSADYQIPASLASFDCSPLSPGDTVTLSSGNRGPLVVRNCNGTATNRITFRNDPTGTEPTVIRRTSGTKAGFIFNCDNCVGIAIDGSYKWVGAPSGKTYGIKVTVTGGAGPSAFMRFGGLSSLITIRNVEVDGAWPALVANGSGIRINDLQTKRSKYPGIWREGILIEDNYVHNTFLEGLYVGNNYNEGALPLRNVEIRNNIVEDTGYEGINTKSMWEGENSIHHNQVRRVGLGSRTNNSAEFSGIKNNAGTVEIYNNWVETTGQHGIQSFTQHGPLTTENRGPFDAYIWNNVVVDAGGAHRSYMGNSYGISIGAQKGCEKPFPFIYNNTIVDSRQGAINISSQSNPGFVRDNLIASAGSNPVIAAPKFVQIINNRVGTIAEMAFVDAMAGNFRLTASSPARNQGSDEYPETDFDDNPRPADGLADQGAFESSE